MKSPNSNPASNPAFSNNQFTPIAKYLPKKSPIGATKAKTKGIVIRRVIVGVRTSLRDLGISLSMALYIYAIIITPNIIGNTEAL